MVSMPTPHLPPDYAQTLRRLSSRLRAARIARGLTQERLAELAGVHRNTIQNIEADRCPERPPAFRTDVLFAIAHTLGIAMEDVFD